MIDTGKIFEDLRKKGFRITPQRETILEFLLSIPAGAHLSAEDLKESLEQQNIKISLATLYRTLKFLTAEGLLREIDLGEDHKHYEIMNENQEHFHLICIKCNKTIEFNSEKLVGLTQEIVNNQYNFNVVDYQFKVFGICEDCQS